jgi:hypothetical protein
MLHEKYSFIKPEISQFLTVSFVVLFFPMLGLLDLIALLLRPILWKKDVPPSIFFLEMLNLLVV